MEGRTRLWRDVALYTTLWTCLGLLDGAQTFAGGRFYAQPVTLSFALGTGLLNWWSCGLQTPVYLWLVRHVPLSGPYLVQRILLYVVILALSPFPKYAVWVPLENLIFHTHWTITGTVGGEIFGVFIGQLSFVVLLYAMEYYRLARARELRASQLEAELSQAQLEALRSQIHPHFLFNTLNSISSLMQRDVKAADEMLSRLSDMLRLTLKTDGSQEARLESELKMLDLYLEIMRVRFGERLRIYIEIDPALLSERVPSFLLQPLVENTIRHGLSESSKLTTIRISADTEGGALILRVLDDGRGLPSGQTLREGIGLSNTRRRLERLYGQTASLDVRSGKGGGTEVEIRIPRRVGIVAPAGAAV